MKYTKYIIDTTTLACDSVSYILSEHNITYIEIEDNIPVDDELQGGTYIELQPDMDIDDTSCRVCFYLEEYSNDPSDYMLDVLGKTNTIEDYSIAIDSLINDIRNELNEIKEYLDCGSLDIRVEVTEDKDWQDNWKEFFKAFEIDNVLIKPTWDQDTKPDSNQILVEIDPGLSFGTGKHETTQLCIMQLQKYLKDQMEVLDLGFGSGILSIIALKIGAGHVVGTDIDPDCVNSAYENFEVNNLSRDLGDFYIGNLSCDKSLQDDVGYDKYDIVVANILADIIIGMSPRIPATMKKDAILITSGIIDFKEQEVVRALEDAGLEILEINHLGEWVNVTAIKR